MAKVLFVAAHPDDETLAMGVALAEHIAAPAHEVHVLWLTQGTKSGARGYLNGIGTDAWWGAAHDPAAEGYPTLDEAAFGAARIAEATTAVLAMASGLGSVSFHEAGLIDTEVTQADAQAAILACCDEIAPANGVVWLKSHTHLVDVNTDHLNAGLAIKALGQANSIRFPTLTYYVKSDFWTDSRLSQVTEAWDTPTDNTIKNRVINACRSFGAWAPEVGRYAIGMHSVSTLFNTQLAAPKNMYYH